MSIFNQDSLVSSRWTVINEGPALEVLVTFKAPIWATGLALVAYPTRLDNPLSLTLKLSTKLGR